MRPQSFDTLCVFDPDVDLDALSSDEWGEFYRTRNPKMIPRMVRPGGHPTRFTIRPIPHGLFRSFVMADGNQADRYTRAFMVGVSKVHDLHQDDGTRTSLEGTGSYEARGVKLKILRDEELEKFSPAEVQEIGRVAFDHSFLARRIGSCFQLPPTSLDILIALGSRNAESNRTSQETPNSEHSGSSETPPAETETTRPQQESASA